MREAKLASVLESPKAKVFAVALTGRGSRPVGRKTSEGKEPMNGGSEILGSVANRARFRSWLVIIG
jgi:hypothetical protein